MRKFWRQKVRSKREVTQAAFQTFGVSLKDFSCLLSIEDQTVSGKSGCRWAAEGKREMKFGDQPLTFQPIHNCSDCI